MASIYPAPHNGGQSQLTAPISYAISSARERTVAPLFVQRAQLAGALAGALGLMVLAGENRKLQSCHSQSEFPIEKTKLQHW